MIEFWLLGGAVPLASSPVLLIPFGGKDIETDGRTDRAGGRAAERSSMEFGWPCYNYEITI
jgi:hypothetical protein